MRRLHAFTLALQPFIRPMVALLNSPFGILLAAGLLILASRWNGALH
jgi:hypothetical protein